MNIPGPSVNDKTLLHQASRLGKRLDGRVLDQVRALKITVVSQGVVQVHLGRTSVLGEVRAELVPPFPDKPNEGMVQLELIPTPMADPCIEPGRSALPETLKDARGILMRSIIRSRCVDTEALCVLAGKLVWSVKIELRILDNGGNVIDCASIAAIAALRNFRVKKVDVVGDVVTVHEPFDYVPVPLTIHHDPISVSFSVLQLPADKDAQVKEEQKVISDPTALEESVADAMIVITASGTQEKSVLFGIHKHGGVPVPVECITRCCIVGQQQAAERAAQIRSILEQYEVWRKGRPMHSRGVGEEPEPHADLHADPAPPPGAPGGGVEVKVEADGVVEGVEGVKREGGGSASKKARTSK